MTQTGAKRPRVMAGMRPSGAVHLGHLVGVLTQWANYCDSADAFFEIADLHARTTDFDDPGKIRRGARGDGRAAWLAAGVDPEKATIFLHNPGYRKIAELQALPRDDHARLLASSACRRIRVRSRRSGRKIATYGFLGYPLLQLCDIAVFRGEYVPVGRDQVAHLELGREIVRRFNYLYGDGREILVEPQPTLSEFPEVPGTDGRKMSKSYDNAIYIADDEETTTRKVRGMITDPLKIPARRSRASGDLPALRPVALRQSTESRWRRRGLPFGRPRLRGRQDGFRGTAERVSPSRARALCGLSRRSGLGRPHHCRRHRARPRGLRPAYSPTSNAQCALT